MNNLLIRAYFDLHGNFEGIGSAFFANKLHDMAQEHGTTVEEYCYQQLGYSADNTYSAIERAQRRRLATDLKDERLLALFPSGSVKRAMLKANNIQPFFSKQPSAHPEVLRDIVMTVANFIEHTDMLALRKEDTGEIVPLRNLFSDLKLARDAVHLDSMAPKAIPPILMVLKGAKIVPGLSASYAAGGRLYLPHKIDDLVLAGHVCQHIGRRSMIMPPEHYYFITGHMGFYQVSDPPKSLVYLKMLDLANIYGMTVAQLIHFLGFRFVNQFEVYKNAGFFLYEIAGTKYLCIDPMIDSSQIEVSYAALRTLYTPERGLLLA